MQLVERYRPTTISAFTGVDRPKRILSAFAAAPYSSAWLLHGPSGLGKTTMALALAETLGGQLHHIASRECNLDTVQRCVDACHYVPWSGRWHCVVVDEADQMSTAAQHAFLSVLDSTNPPPDSVFVFTSNSLAKLEERFISRCRPIEFSGADLDLVALLRSIWKAEAEGREGPDFEAIAMRAKTNVRAAIMDLEVELMIAPPAKKKLSAVELIARWEQRWKVNEVAA